MAYKSIFQNYGDYIFNGTNEEYIQSAKIELEWMKHKLYLNRNDKDSINYKIIETKIEIIKDIIKEGESNG